MKCDAEPQERGPCELGEGRDCEKGKQLPPKVTLKHKSITLRASSPHHAPTVEMILPFRGRVGVGSQQGTCGFQQAIDGFSHDTSMGKVSTGAG